MDRVSSNTAMRGEEAQLPDEIAQLEKEVKNLQDRYQELLPSIDDKDSGEVDKTQTYLQDSIKSISKQFKTHLSKNYQNFDNQQVTEEEAYLENIQRMRQKKDEQIAELTSDVKVIKKVNVAIKGELEKGDEVMTGLQNDIQTTTTGVKAVNSKTQAFRDYLKRNKVPIPFTILCLIITICVWSSQGLCSWNVRSGCPP